MLATGPLLYELRYFQDALAYKYLFFGLPVFVCVFQNYSIHCLHKVYKKRTLKQSLDYAINHTHVPIFECTEILKWIRGTLPSNSRWSWTLRCNTAQVIITDAFSDIHNVPPILFLQNTLEGMVVSSVDPRWRFNQKIYNYSVEFLHE